MDALGGFTKGSLPWNAHVASIVIGSSLVGKLLKVSEEPWSAGLQLLLGHDTVPPSVYCSAGVCF